MTRFGDRLRDERKARKQSQDSAADFIGVERAAFGKVERGETVRPNDWEKYASAFGIPIDEADEMIRLDALDAGKETKVGGAMAILRNHVSSGTAGKLPFPSMKRQLPPGKIPIHGFAAAGDPDRLIMMNETTDYADRHPNLGAVEGGYAVYVHGTSMMPRYIPGELVYVDPYKPLRERGYCVVQVGDDPSSPEGGYIKQYLGWGDNTLHLYQLNPEKPFDIPAKRVISIHRIVGTAEH